jgi:hypothetical protein
MKPYLFVDTNFGLGDFDYVNCKDYELSKRLFNEKRVERDIDINFSNKIKLSFYEFSSLNQKFNEHNLTCEVGCCIPICSGPEQSYYSELGEYNSIEIYICILRAMWGDFKTHNQIKSSIRLRRLIRNNIRKDKKCAFLKLKYATFNDYQTSKNVSIFICCLMLTTYLYMIK